MFPPPIPTPTPGPKARYPSAWRKESCRAIAALTLGVGHLASMREYVYAGDWGNVRFQAAAARSEGYRVLEHLLGTWKPVSIPPRHDRGCPDRDRGR